MSFWSPGVAYPVTSDFIPVTTSLYSLGSTVLKWKDLYLSGNATIDGQVNVTSKLQIGSTTGSAYKCYIYGNQTASLFALRQDGAGHIQDWLGPSSVVSAYLDVSGFFWTGSTGLIGYGVGAGGTVTQLTNKTTTVTLNKVSGLITTHNANLAAGASAAFLVSNSLCTDQCSVIVNLKNGTYATTNTYDVKAEAIGNGSFIVVLTNKSAGGLTEAVGIIFNLIKSSIA